MRLKTLRAFAATSLLLILSACGGGGGTAGGTSFTGKFIDAAVSGMAYRCGSSSTTSGTTTATGEYTCSTGQAVAFYVGDILIGSVSSATAVVTPMDLVGTTAGPTTPAVMNIVRFLMSISSTDPTTGTLTIAPAVAAAAAGKTADFSTGGAALDSLITTVRPTATKVYTTAEATTHITSSIKGLFAGSYAGTYAGSSSGKWSITIAADGSVSGTSDNGAVTGTMATSLSTGATTTYGFSGSAGGIPWTGGLNVSTKVFSGTWNGGADSSGTFTGAASAAASTSTVSAGTITVSAATDAALNGNYIPVCGATSPPTGATAGANCQTSDSKFEMEVGWDGSSVVKTAHIWFRSGASAPSILGFFGCNGASEPCTGVTYDPATKKITFTAVTFVETSGPLVTSTATGSGKSITLNGSATAL